MSSNFADAKFLAESIIIGPTELGDDRRNDKELVEDRLSEARRASFGRLALILLLKGEAKRRITNRDEV